MAHNIFTIMITIMELMVGKWDEEITGHKAKRQGRGSWREWWGRGQFSHTLLGFGLWSSHGLDLKRFPCRFFFNKCILKWLVDKNYPQNILRIPDTDKGKTGAVRETPCGKATMSYFRLDVLTLCGPTWLGLTKQFFGTLWGILWDPANLTVLYMQSAICINSTQALELSNSMFSASCFPQICSQQVEWLRLWTPSQSVPLYNCHSGACSGDRGPHSTDGEQ